MFLRWAHGQASPHGPEKSESDVPTFQEVSRKVINVFKIMCLGELRMDIALPPSLFGMADNMEAT